MAPKHVNKSAITGKFVSKATVQRHPKTTVTQTTRPTSKMK
jgi:hypothetical protein